MCKQSLKKFKQKIRKTWAANWYNRACSLKCVCLQAPKTCLGPEAILTFSGNSSCIWKKKWTNIEMAWATWFKSLNQTSIACTRWMKYPGKGVCPSDVQYD